VAQVGRISGAVLKDNLLRDSSDLAFDSDLLYLKVPTEVRRANPNEDGDPNFDLGLGNRGSELIGIGINTNAPNATLDVREQIGSTNLLSNYLNVSPNIEIANNSITAVNGNLFLKSSNTITASTLATNDIKIDDNIISTLNGSNLEVRPVGAGKTVIYNDWINTGDIHSTGNITFGGDLTIGDSDDDSIDFNADIKSDIIPNTTDQRNLGSPDKKWLSLYTNLLNGRVVDVEEFLSNGTSLSRRQGNIFYVSTLGDDANVGDHQNGAFRTLEHALSVVDASTGGPVTIHVFPGVYEEICPLIVPDNVTISGEDIRNTIIVPTVATQNQDIFLLEQNTVIENITIKDFYYDNVNNTGYAFRFSPGAIMSERSPYIRNVTIITQGSTTSSDDPGGFLAGDAGRGAWIDGSELNSATINGTMLFHAATFITPGADTIIMTNGVRVEWLNSFTYFSNIGLQATQGALGLGGNGIRYGAELRSINSANVYGNYGAVANGTDTLMYLIGHNFGYIGVGRYVNNDPSLALQDQETVEQNNGKIYYVTTDHQGTFRVGDSFFVNFEDGTTSFNIGEVSLQDVSAIYINTNGNITYIDGERISTGNIKFSGNTISTLSGDLIWHPDSRDFLIAANPTFILPKGDTGQQHNESADIRYNTDFDIYEGFGESNVTFGGIYSQDRRTSVAADRLIDDDIIFTVSNNELGRLVPNMLQMNNVSVDDININNNIIKTTTTDTDLLLTTGTNEVVSIDNITISANAINPSSGTLNFAHTGQGYLKFNTTGGVVIPAGDTSNRHQNPEVGTVRYNSDVGSLEIWNGTAWVNVIEDSEGATEEDLQEFLNLYVLVLG
jgi:hypothetical protein